MAIGGLFAIPELQAEGPARLLGVSKGFVKIRFLTTGAEMTQESRQVVRYFLMPGTRVRLHDDVGGATVTLAAEAPTLAKPSGLVTYPLEPGEGAPEAVREDHIEEVEKEHDPLEQLRTVGFHDLQPRFARAGTPKPPLPWGPQTWCSRQAVLGWVDSGWGESGGVVGLAGGRVIPMPHQILAARRILADRQVRFLLADEVGLGKTIEAGLVMQSLLAMDPRLRVLVIAPGALVSQWFVELYIKFGGRQFLMVDADRLEDSTLNPWESQFVLASTGAIESLTIDQATDFGSAAWDLVIVDECHRMHPGGVLYNRVANLAADTPSVLLLSATPPRQHADAYLGLMHLLQPDAYSLDDSEGFAKRLKMDAELGILLGDTRNAVDDGDRQAVAARWQSTFGDDPVLQDLVQAFVADSAALPPLEAYVRERYRLDHRVIRHRRRVLQELAGAAGVPPLALAGREQEMIPYALSEGEEAALSMLQAYSRKLLASRNGTVPPRLAHWLLQLQLAAAAHPNLLDRLLAMRQAVLADRKLAAEYRDRIKGTETMASVLRTDLSEAENNTHLAVSASCFADPKIENKILAAFRNAVEEWKEEGVPARAKALIERLRTFWEDYPEEKVLVFTSHAVAVEAIAEHLEDAFGDGVITTFGAHQEAGEREESARKFRDDRRTWVMVCDSLGGEGRNFQFVSVVAHHDLPWSLGGVEQRIGRVDRVGRDGMVPSWVFHGDNDALVDTAWARTLAQATGVFEASASGLEFIAANLEERAWRLALEGGEALAAGIEDLVAYVAEERAADDERADTLVHDGADAFAEAVAMAQRAAAAPVPVSGICRWLRGMGGRVRREEDGVRPFQLRTRSAEKPLTGVFDREQALKREDIAFFARGHDLIDNLVADAGLATWCSATAWRRKPTAGIDRWEGIRVDFETFPDLLPLLQEGFPISTLRRVFTVAPPRRERRYIDVEGQVVTDPTLLSVLDKDYDPESGDSCLSAKSSRDSWMRPLVSGRVQQIIDWQQRMTVAADRARAFVEEFQSTIGEETLAAVGPVMDGGCEVARSLAATAAERLGADHLDARRLGDEAEEEERQARALKAAVKGMQVRIAGAAYLVVA